MTNEYDILIDADGTARFVYSDALAEMFEGEEMRTSRASRVDYDNERGGWMADILTPRSEREAELYGQYLSGHWFWSRIRFEGDCWIVAGTASCGSSGYAAVRPPAAAGLGRKMFAGHRLAYWLAFGEWLPLVRHACDRPRCIRPSHLLRGTQLDNVHDSMTRGRAANGNIKLNPEAWNAIRASDAPVRELAHQYGVSEGHVRKIRRRISGVTYRPKIRREQIVFAPVRLGPFATRAAALDAERAWLRERLGL